MAGRKGLGGEAGFSLIEVLVSLVILAVGLLSLALLQVTAIKGNASASKSTIATEQANDRLERFRRVSWDNIASSTTTAFGNSTGTTIPVFSALPDAQGDNVVVRGTTYYRIWRVVPNASDSLKTITVWTCWQDDNGFWHSVMLVTQRANVG